MNLKKDKLRDPHLGTSQSLLQDKKRIWKVAREKSRASHKRIPNENSSLFLIRNHGGQKADIFNMLKEKDFQPRIQHKTTFKIKSKLKFLISTKTEKNCH